MDDNIKVYILNCNNDNKFLVSIDKGNCDNKTYMFYEMVYKKADSSFPHITPINNIFLYIANNDSVIYSENLTQEIKKLYKEKRIDFNYGKRR